MSTAPLSITDEFADALERLHAGQNLFLTGKAGTGKSTLIRLFMGQVADERNLVVAAPTGIAALNVDGYTIHRLFSFGPSTTREEVEHSGYYPGRFAKTLGGLDTLILDEASMIRADLLDLVEAALRRYGPRPGTAFGGVQLVLVGDLYQLPPVVGDGEAEYFRTHYDSPFFFSAKAFTQEAFPTVELTTVFRQRGDRELADILNSVRDATLDDEARAELNARVDKEFEPPNDEFW